MILKKEVVMNSNYFQGVGGKYPYFYAFPDPIPLTYDPDATITGPAGLMVVNTATNTVWLLAGTSSGLPQWREVAGTTSNTFASITVTTGPNSITGTTTIPSGSWTWTLGDIIVAAGNITATLGAVSAGTTVTAGNGVIATAGGVTATAGDITATAGDIVATAGAVSAGTTVTAGTGVIATTGGVTATAGDITATANNIVASAGNITATLGLVSGVAVRATGTNAGLAGTTTLVNDTAGAAGAGVFTIKSNSANNADSTGFIAVRVGTDLKYIPFFDNPNP